MSQLDHVADAAQRPGGARPALVRPGMSVMGFTVVDGKIAAIDVLWDPERLGELDLPALT